MNLNILFISFLILSLIAGGYTAYIVKNYRLAIFLQLMPKHKKVLNLPPTSNWINIILKVMVFLLAFRLVLVSFHFGLNFQESNSAVPPSKEASHSPPSTNEITPPIFDTFNCKN